MATRRDLREIGGIGLAIGVALWPALSNPGRWAPGDGGDDAARTVWLAGRFAAGGLYQPWGADVGGAMSFAGLPFVALLGTALGPLAWTAAILLANAWAGARIAASLGVAAGSRWPAALSLVLNPYVLGELDAGRPLQAFLLPAAMTLCGLWTLKSPRDGAVAGAWIVVSAACWWYAGALLAVLALVTGATRGTREILPRYAAVAALGAVAALLAYDPGAIVDIAPVRAVSGPAVVGLVHVAVAVVALRRGVPGWLVACLAVALLATLPQGADGGAWLQGRGAFAFHLALAPLVPAALAQVLPRWRSAAGALLVVGVLAPMLLSGTFPLGRWDAGPPPGVRCLARAPAGAVIDLPLPDTSRALVHQATHRHGLLVGIGPAPVEQTRLLAENAWLATVVAIGDGRYNQRAPDDVPGRDALLALGFRYVLAHVEAFSVPYVARDGSAAQTVEWSRPRRALVRALGDPGWEDPAVAVWSLDGTAIGCSGATRLEP